MPSKECSLKRGRGGTELPGSPTGAACNSSNISFEWSSTILVLGRVLEGFSEGFAFLDWQFPLAVQHADLFCCSDALIFQSQCSLCSKSVHMEVQVRLGFWSTSHCFTHLSDLWEVRVIPLTHQNISSHQRMDTEQWWDIMGAPQARSTEFSDFSRSPAYCPSCTGGRLEVSKLFHKTTRFRSPYSLSLNGHCTLNFFLPILIP